MFALLKDPKFDFMGQRKVLLSVSLVIVLACVAVIAVRGVNLGIEFAGGNELQVRFADSPDIGAIRSALAAAGMSGAVVTTIGAESENEVYIRIAGDESGDRAPEVLQALRGATNDNDLNVMDQGAIENLLRETSSSLSGDQAAALATAIAERRKDVAIFHTVDELADVEGMIPEVLDDLRRETTLGTLALRSQSFIGPAIGRELMNKAMFAILGSLVGMLVYIWIRFQLQWGFAAVAALTHDTLITLGLFSLFGKEMSLPVVAAFLTLVGYSVNDTVVVFDRIRENLRTKRTENFEAVINLSINQTLSRTIITSGLTWIVVFSLLIWGGKALNPFSFVLTIGVAVGTYSSVYIASPILVMWQRFIDRRRSAAGTDAPARGDRRAKKVRTGSAG